jgi:hypothetical protein
MNELRDSIIFYQLITRLPWRIIKNPIGYQNVPLTGHETA